MFFRGIQFSLFALLSLFLANALGFYSVTLGWDPPTTYTDGSPLDPTDLGGYILYYGTGSQQYTANVDVVGNVTRATIGGLLDATTYYVVATAYALSGIESAFSSPEVVVSPPAPGDTTPPTVSMTSPANNTSVPRKSTVTLAAVASDNVGVTMVTFFVNGRLTCSDATSAYTCAWNVPASPNRTYQLQAKAYDAQGNIGTSSTITVVSR
jgi:Bacterial Ig domain